MIQEGEVITPRTKLVATLGPATNRLEMIVRLIETGVDVFRLNMAHGDISGHGQVVQQVREASRTVGDRLGFWSIWLAP
ncbi:MAG TPA: pyruvate kinase, partial [Pirellulaceae bacterium]|nr:pyruvate kinase [Pirellulaceae bacterium]